MSDGKSFAPEIQFWREAADLIEFINDWLEEHEWKMSPSRGYALIAALVRREQALGTEPTNEPAFDFVVERIEARAKELTGSTVDLKYAMVMDDWRDRKLPVPGHPYLSITQIFDWFVPMLRILEGLGVAAVAKTSSGGGVVTKAEAAGWIFSAVDHCYKDQHFQTRNAWGWPTPYRWIDFCRDEFFAWKKMLEDTEPVPLPSGGVAFSGGPS